MSSKEYCTRQAAAIRAYRRHNHGHDNNQAVEQWIADGLAEAWANRYRKEVKGIKK